MEYLPIAWAFKRQKAAEDIVTWAVENVDLIDTPVAELLGNHVPDSLASKWSDYELILDVS